MNTETRSTRDLRDIYVLNQTKPEDLPAVVKRLAAEPVKLCKDCRHFRLAGLQCHHPQNVTVNLVMGGGTQTISSYSLRAVGGGGCGPLGEWFEANAETERGQQ